MSGPTPSAGEADHLRLASPSHPDRYTSISFTTEVGRRLTVVDANQIGNGFARSSMLSVRTAWKETQKSCAGRHCVVGTNQVCSSLVRRRRYGWGSEICKARLGRIARKFEIRGPARKTGSSRPPRSSADCRRSAGKLFEVNAAHPAIANAGHVRALPPISAGLKAVTAPMSGGACPASECREMARAEFTENGAVSLPKGSGRWAAANTAGAA